MATQNIQKLQTLQSVIISAPFITIEFGGHQFGLKKKYDRTTYVRQVEYVTDLTIQKKASGQVNTYTVNMTYVVEPGADPNWIDYIISNASNRKILFTYGDASQPEYSYVEEEAIITNVVPSVSMSNNAISYTITATSSVSLTYGIKRTFEATTCKPSDQLIKVLYDTSNGLLELFTGMTNKTAVLQNGWIARNDKSVYLERKEDIAPLDYLRYLLSCMQATDGSIYAMVIYDEPDNVDGPYFKIINSNLYQGSGTIYSVDIDVGYPSDTPIFEFTPSQTTSLALITALQEKVDSNRVTDINADGSLSTSNTPSLAVANGYASSQMQAWWATMTAYPVNATLKTRGLIKPSILCEYIQINVLFFGQRYNYSGLYMVTAQKDLVSATSGYTTELTLVRTASE